MKKQKAGFYPKVSNNDKEFMLAALQQNRGAFFYASEELKNDEEIIQAVLKQNPMCIT
ncbi:MAG: DUF4116 domain-containing protein [Parachlamydiaceae bacterium]